MIGRTYLERGEPVVVLVRWAAPPERRTYLCDDCGRFVYAPPGAVGHLATCCARQLRAYRRVGGPVRNVLIRRGDGSLVIRPFRGLRRPR